MIALMGTISTQLVNPTRDTMKKVTQFIDYSASHNDTITTYKASDMGLAVHSDASYLYETKARSQARGHFYMSNNSASPQNIGAVLTLAQIIKAVMSSSAEAKLGALYISTAEDQSRNYRPSKK